jgi:hypothetical protein
MPGGRTPDASTKPPVVGAVSLGLPRPLAVVDLGAPSALSQTIALRTSQNAAPQAVHRNTPLINPWMARTWLANVTVSLWQAAQRRSRLGQLGLGRWHGGGILAWPVMLRVAAWIR